MSNLSNSFLSSKKSVRSIVVFMIVLFSMFSFSFQPSSTSKLDITITPSSPDHGQNNGSIHIVISGSESDFTVLFFDETNPLHKEFKNNHNILVDHLTAGKYEIIIHSKNSSPYMETVVLSERP